MQDSIVARGGIPGRFFHLKSSLLGKARASVVLAACSLLPATTFAAGSSTVVISQIYGAGGNSGATLNADYVELFNRSNNAVDLTGWSLQYASTTGNFGSPTVLSGSIPAGGYYLVQASVASASNGVAPTLAYDLPLASGSGLSIAAAGGKVVLAETTSSLACGATGTTPVPCDAAHLALIVDLVGQSTATLFEGAGAAPATSTTNADIRAGAGCTDTDNNNADFAAQAITAGTPRNHTTTALACATAITFPTGAGSADTNPAAPNQITKLTVVVTPGASPASSGITVTADLSAFGGSATQTLYDDGTHGDTSTGDNTFSFDLTIPAAQAGGNYSIPVTIKDAQHRKTTTTIALAITAPPSLSIGNVTQNEGDSGTTAFNFTVTLSATPTSDVTVQYATTDGSATVADNDYTATSGTLTFAANTTTLTQTIPVDVIGDTKNETDETFTVVLNNPVNATIAAGTGTGTIKNDDAPPTLSINNVSQNEGDSGTTEFTFTVTLSASPDADVTLHYATADGTATAGSDYTAIADTVMTFTAGTATLTQTITVNVNGDTTYEPDETFKVNLSNATNATIANATGTGTIKNDDALAVSIMAIQGQGTSSAYAGASGAASSTILVTPDPAGGHQNIVTAVKGNGFYMQDATGDNDTTTSDGIFVFTSTAPGVVLGNSVSVKGKIQEFHGSTEMVQTTVTVLDSGAVYALPAAWDLSAHAPSHDPTTGICANAAINASTAGYQANNFACLDGMLVSVSQGTAVTAVTGSKSYSTTPISDGVHPNTVEYFYATADGTRPMRTPGIDFPGDSSRPDIPVYSDAPEAFEVYFPGLGFNATNFVYNGGTQFHASGIMTGFSSSTTGGVAKIYELYPITMATDNTPTYPVVVATPEPGKLTIGTQNMLHFFNASNDGSNDSSQYTDTCSGDGSTDQCPTPAEYGVRLQKMSKQIRLTLKAPVVQVVQELENYSVLVDLANQIHSDDASLTYVPYSIRSNDPGGINIGILVRDGVTVNSVTQFFRDTKVSDACNPSFPVPCLLNDRPPVLLDATYQGYRFRVLAIYHRSLGSLAKTGYVGQKRMEQAVQVAGLIQALQTTGQFAVGNTRQAAGGVSTDGSFTVNGDATIPLVVLGDFNAYEFSDGFVDVTGLIMGTAVTNNSGTYPCPTYYCPTNAMDVGSYTAPSPVLVDSGTYPDPNGNYSYTFNAYSQEIDHIVMTARANQDFVRISHAHGNADASDSADTTNAYGALMLDPTTAVRTSDHDGQVVTLGYVVTPNPGNYGTISPSAMQTISSTTPAVFTVTPNLGSGVATVTDTCGVGGTSVGSLNGTSNTYTVPAGVNRDCQVSATFTTPDLELSVSSLPSTVAQYSEQQLIYTLKVNNPNAGLANPAFGTSVTNATIESISAPNEFTCGGSAYEVTCLVRNSGGIAPPYDDVKFIVTLHADGPIGSTIDASGRFDTYAGLGPSSETSTSTTIVSGLVNGTCGLANGSAFVSLSSDNSTLCGSGKLVNFTGSGPWQWTCSGVGGGTDSSACSANKGYTVTATAGESGFGYISPQSQIVASGNTASLVVVPSAGYSASASGDTCTVTHDNGNTWTTNAITTDCTVAATFSELTYTVTTTVNGVGGTISAPARSPVPYHQLTTFTVTPLPTYSIATVTGDTCSPYLLGGSGSTWETGAISADCKITATFSAIVINGACGSADTGAFTSLSSGSPNLCSAGTATNFPGSHAWEWTWTCAGSNGGANSSTCAANKLYTVTASAGPHGSITPVSQTVPYNQGAWFTVTPDAGYTAVLTGDTCKVGSVNTAWGAGPITSDCAVSATFIPVSSYVSLTPSRILDTRPIGTTADGLFAAGGALANQQNLELSVLGRGGIPLSGVKAVVLNVTATEATAPTYVSVWPTGSNRPVTSNLNVLADQTIANLVIVKVGDNGRVSFYNNSGATQLIVDVQGYFTDTSDLTPLVPMRALDTRPDSPTFDGLFEGQGAVPANGQIDLSLSGRGSIPAVGADAVILNVTATDPITAGYITAWPSDQPRPPTSNLNFDPGQTIPNLAISKLSSSGQVSLYNSTGATQLIADVMGWFPAASDLHTLAPARLLDTRPGVGQTVDGNYAGTGAVAPQGWKQLAVLGRGNVPANGVGAVVLNVTVTGPTAPGYMTVWQNGMPQPLASNLNFVANQTIANLVIVKVGPALDEISLSNSSTGSTHMVVDVVGWFPPSE